ncbi:MAG: sulfite exporter TauE/SafE family protein [Deltaproteobacteria bacterium]|nr:MAG: sulfite exporter TauE/SafE family protein [Deltaproteobacteria bacterium]
MDRSPSAAHRGASLAPGGDRRQTRAVPTPNLALLSAVVLVAFTAEATAGFGSTVLSLTLGSLFAPIPVLLPIVVPLNVGLTVYLVARHAHHVAWRLLWMRVLPLMAAGGAIGYAVGRGLDAAALRRVLGALVVAVSARELWRLARPGAPPRPLPPAATAACIGAAGVVHGMLATGGPLLVYALGRADLSKGALRSTLAVLWLVLNAALLAAFIADGRLGGAQLRAVAALVPALAVAIALGERVHRRIPERPFRAVVFGLLLVAGGLSLA